MKQYYPSNNNPVRIWDGRDVVGIDRTVHSMQMIDVEHHEIHEGEAYHASHLFEDVADDGGVFFRLKPNTENCEYHLALATAVGGSSRAYLYRNPTLTNSGTVVGPRNRNEWYDSDTGTLSVRHTPTITANGTRYKSTVIPGGSKNFASGGAAIGRLEWILRYPYDYLIRVVNVSGGVVDVSIELEWYEEPR